MVPAQVKELLLPEALEHEEARHPGLPRGPRVRAWGASFTTCGKAISKSSSTAISKVLERTCLAH